jgi:hypothetical protein
MTEEEKLARGRYYAMIAVEIAGVAGAVFGLVVIGKTNVTWLKLLGAAILLSAMLMIAVVPRSMARRWRSPR